MLDKLHIFAYVRIYVIKILISTKQILKVKISKNNFFLYDYYLPIITMVCYSEYVLFLHLNAPATTFGEIFQIYPTE